MFEIALILLVTGCITIIAADVLNYLEGGLYVDPKRDSIVLNRSEVNIAILKIGYILCFTGTLLLVIDTHLNYVRK